MYESLDTTKDKLLSDYIRFIRWLSCQTHNNKISDWYEKAILQEFVFTTGIVSIRELLLLLRHFIHPWPSQGITVLCLKDIECKGFSYMCVPLNIRS